MIENAETHALVGKLLKDLPMRSQVWINGRGSGDETWRYMNGTNFPNQGDA